MAASAIQRWQLGLAGVLTALNKGFHHEIGGWGAGDHTVGWCKNVLANSWGIRDAKGHAECLDYLWKDGHRMEVFERIRAFPQDGDADDAQAAILRKNLDALRGRSLLAWDLGRFVAVAGWGVWAGFLDESEFWRMTHGAATWAQRSYRSWEEFGRHYEIGRLYWANGESDPRIGEIITTLISDAKSPWVELPWSLPLGNAPTRVDPTKHRIKRTICGSCGAPKQVPPKTGWVYCDCCGELADWDFRTACSTAGSMLPGPAYEALYAQLSPQLEAARKAGDAQRCVELQTKLFTAWVEACPASCPPRIGDVRYRKSYVDYMAGAAAATDLDAEWQKLAIEVRMAMARLVFVGPPTAQKVRADVFWPLFDAVRRQTARGMDLYEAAGILDRHPDHPSAELQTRLTWSVFAQGWLRFLPDMDGQKLLAETGLEGEYEDVPDVATEGRHCGHCGGAFRAVPNARKVVCESCGYRVDVGTAELPCGQCGGRISLPEGEARTACPFCQTMVSRV